MLDKFRKYYPHGSLISELVHIDRGKYIVRALIQAENITLATGFAAADTIEEAEDRARQRAIELLDFNETAIASSQEKKIEAQQEIKAVKQTKNSESLEREKRLESLLSQNKVESTKSISSQSNGVGVTPKQIPDTLATQSPPLNLVEEPLPLPEPEEPIFPSKPEKLDLNSDRPVASNEPPGTLETPLVPSVSSKDTTEEASFEDFLAKTSVHIKRLGWTNDQGRDYLLQTYGKRSRHLLTDEELRDFLEYLESQP